MAVIGTINWQLVLLINNRKSLDFIYPNLREIEPLDEIDYEKFGKSSRAIRAFNDIGDCHGSSITTDYPK